MSTFERFEGEVPWAHMSAKMAARELGVAPELVEGLCANRQIEAIRSASKDGRTPVWLIRKSAVAELAEKMRA